MSLTLALRLYSNIANQENKAYFTVHSSGRHFSNIALLQSQSSGNSAEMSRETMLLVSCFLTRDTFQIPRYQKDFSSCSTFNVSYQNNLWNLELISLSLKINTNNYVILQTF